MPPEQGSEGGMKEFLNRLVRSWYTFLSSPKGGHTAQTSAKTPLTAPCGDVAPPVIDGVWGCLLRRPPEEDRGHRQARLGLSKATWGNVIATRYQNQCFTTCQYL